MDLDEETCGAEDAVMGAICTLALMHEPPHKDESDPLCTFTFRDEQKLIVPGSGTDDLDPLATGVPI